MVGPVGPDEFRSRANPDRHISLCSDELQTDADIVNLTRDPRTKTGWSRTETMLEISDQPRPGPPKF